MHSNWAQINDDKSRKKSLTKQACASATGKAGWRWRLLTLPQLLFQHRFQYILFLTDEITWKRIFGLYLVKTKCTEKSNHVYGIWCNKFKKKNQFLRTGILKYEYCDRRHSISPQRRALQRHPGQRD